MFSSEANMNQPVCRWLESLGMSVKAEFITPWGICDLVASKPRKQNLARRLRLGQTQPISSLIRSALLLRIPDTDSDDSVTIRGLVRECAPFISKDIVVAQTQKLIADGFVLRQAKGGLQKLNGWMPLHKRLVAVELKLSRVEQAMFQAQSNLTFADESYVALPKEVAYRVATNPARWQDYFDVGVGLIAVSARTCEILKRPRHRLFPPDPVLQFYCVEKFWRSYAISS